MMIKLCIWQQLPTKIRNRILYLFTLQIIDAYKQLGIDPWSDNNMRAIQEFNGRQPVNCLLHFSWALRIYRYFNHALSNEIKIKGMSCTETLQHLQYRRVQEILDAQCPVPFNQHSAIVLFPMLMGCFLKNKTVLEFPLVETLLTRFSDITVRVIPHLEDWVVSCATRRTEPCSVTIEMEGKRDMGSDYYDEYELMTFR